MLHKIFHKFEYDLRQKAILKSTDSVNKINPANGWGPLGDMCVSFEWDRSLLYSQAHYSQWHRSLLVYALIYHYIYFYCSFAICLVGYTVWYQGRQDNADSSSYNFWIGKTGKKFPLVLRQKNHFFLHSFWRRQFSQIHGIMHFHFCWIFHFFLPHFSFFSWFSHFNIV